VIRRAVFHFLFQLVIALCVAAVIAALWALVHGGGFIHSLHIGLYVIGALAFLVGALGVGGESPAERLIATPRIPGVPAFMRPDETTEVNATAIFLLTGAVVIAIAVFV
jgi:hypothetical protein